MILFLALFASPVAAQTDQQIWGELTLDWIKSHMLTFGVDVEPKLLVAKQPGEAGWATLDVTPRTEYARGKWFDIVGELHLGRTRQTDQQDSTEVTPRVGLRFHLLSNIVDDLIKERQPRRRLVLRNFARVEWRNLRYSDGTPPSSTVRYRDRIESLFPVNRPRVSDDGVLYGSADVNGSGPTRIRKNDSRTNSAFASARATGGTPHGVWKRSTCGTVRVIRQAMDSRQAIVLSTFAFVECGNDSSSRSRNARWAGSDALACSWHHHGPKPQDDRWQSARLWVNDSPVTLHVDDHPASLRPFIQPTR